MGHSKSKSADPVPPRQVAQSVPSMQQSFAERVIDQKHKQVINKVNNVVPKSVIVAPAVPSITPIDQKKINKGKDDNKGGSLFDVKNEKPPELDKRICRVCTFSSPWNVQKPVEKNQPPVNGNVVIVDDGSGEFTENLIDTPPGGADVR